MLTKVFEGGLQAITQMVSHAAGDADTAGLGQGFYPRRNVHPVTENVAVLHHDVADIDADSQKHAMRLGKGGVCARERLLHCDRARIGAHYAGKLGQDAVAGRAENLPMCSGNQVVHDQAMRRERG